MFEEETAPAAEETPEVDETQDETPEVKEEEVKEESKEEQESPAEIEFPKPKKKTAQERIDELTKKRREAEREAEYWRKKALEEKAEQKPPQVSPTHRPVMENFNTVTEYEDALFEWNDRRKEDARRAELSQKEAEQRAQEETEDWKEFNKKAESLRAEYEDFDDVTSNPVYSDAMRSVLLKSDNGPDVAYYLGRPENREVAEKILALTPERQIYEIGRLETKIVLARKQKKPTGAPPPLKPVGYTGVTVDEANLSDDDWYKREQQREHEKAKKKLGL